MKQDFSRTCICSFLPTIWLASLVGLARLACGTDSEPATTNAQVQALETLVSDVLEHNPELEFYKWEILAARGERRSAGAWSNPELSGRLGDKRAEATGASGEGVAWSVTMRQTFEWPGRIPLRKAIANRQIKLAELGLGQFRTALEARARTLAYGLF